jgi:hypothetical protein
MEDPSSRRVRTLVTQKARRDLSGNKIARAWRLWIAAKQLPQKNIAHVSERS